MIDIEEVKRRRLAAADKNRRRIAVELGWEDEDGTIIVPEDEWEETVAIFGQDPKGFRKETEIDRMRAKKAIEDHPERIAEISKASAEERRYIDLWK